MASRTALLHLDCLVCHDYRSWAVRTWDTCEEEELSLDFPEVADGERRWSTVLVGELSDLDDEGGRCGKTTWSRREKVW